MPEPKQVETLGPGQRTNSEAPKAAEDKRLAARRRFIKGGAAALPVIVTLGQKQALAASVDVCTSAGLGFGTGLTADEIANVKLAQEQGLSVSIFCRP